jgi:type IV pilus assembly protein PilE
MSGHRRASGVTLIELLIVMSIIGILAAIAYPSYQSHIAKTSRKAAQSCLSQYANFMERYYTTNLTYVNASPPVLGCSTESNLDRSYSFPAPTVATASTYSISAVPTTSQRAKDPGRCGTLTLDQAGTRGAESSNCW